MSWSPLWRHKSELRALIFKCKHKVEEQTGSKDRLMILNPIPSDEPPARLHHLKFPKQDYQLRAKYANTPAYRGHFLTQTTTQEDHSEYGCHHTMGGKGRMEAGHQHFSMCVLLPDAVCPAASLSCHHAFPSMMVYIPYLTTSQIKPSPPWAVSCLVFN